MKRSAPLLLWLTAAGCFIGRTAPDPRYKEEVSLRAWQDGEREFAAGHPAVAVERYTKAIELSVVPFPQAHLGRARALEALGEHAAARAGFTAALEQAPDDKKSIYLFHRGRHAQRRLDPRQALADFTRAAELEAEWPEPEYALAIQVHRGLALIDLGRADEAIGVLEAILKRNPDAEMRRQVEELKAKAREGDSKR